MLGVQWEFLCHLGSFEKCGGVTHAFVLKIIMVLSGYLSVVDQITRLFGQLFDLAQTIRDLLSQTLGKSKITGLY